MLTIYFLKCSVKIYFVNIITMTLKGGFKTEREGERNGKDRQR